MKLGMLVCCTVMLAPAIGWFALGGTVASLGEAVTVLGPIAACLALHGAMFLVMGRSCHDAGSETNDVVSRDVPEVVKVPTVSRTTARAEVELAQGA